MADAMPEGSAVLERLRDEGIIADDQYQAALLEAMAAGCRCEEAVVRLGVLPEAQLLKTLAGWYRTQFIGTEKLSRADIDPQLLRLVPRRIANRLGIFPVLYKRRSRQLVVVSVAPNEGDIEKQVQMVADVHKVAVLVARPAAIEAAIKKHYDRDPRAFANLVKRRRREPPPPSDFGMGGGFDAFGSGGFDDFESLAAAAPAPAAPSSAPKATPPAPSFTIEAPDVVAGLQSLPEPAPRDDERLVRPKSVLPPPRVEAPLQVPVDAHLELLKVVVALLERERDELRGHSSRVANLTRDLGVRLGLSPEALYHVSLAGLFHDVGKTGSYHLTALNVARYEGHRLQAEKNYLTPVRLFESARVPPEALTPLKHLYERWDGRGFPDRLAGKDIPLGARIVAVAETFLDLTTHAKNPYRRKLSSAEAVSVIAGLAEKLFDPTICQALRQVVGGDALRRKLLADRRTVLLVDPDPEETAVLDMRFGSAGFDVLVARDAAEAGKKIESGVDVVLSEVELPGERDGFELLEKLRAAGHEQPFVFLTRRGDSSSAERGFELGVADFMVKPAAPDVVVAKVRQLLERKSSGARGVSGSLREMSLPDVIQILSNGRKGGRLTVRSKGKSGEVHFRDGAIWDARFGGERGEEAFYALLVLEDGEFELDPAFQPTERKIEAATESLLLEGMRRFDEAGR
ncbi:MAG TPA: DUF4388 domain-containing protein [Polyangiaceae bacterium LLY-WYZ-15_(1-7)]|nr:DUF4388 domain-containing protein [Polyangiaceae bacterium LLY-WYZ-15_(1-7)]HJL06665.1 DUF4388 domain-containing protein [Polyangiaceae bacterium LLY-WYZ-15_(1-7)]HJL07305.1 DUF4388 domain-containing protein [Polyangiaceae bacterium LLY-WYZ-15_(1-7)]HJL26160.1 DUF4388 domain-containing protein [Polyangiaceae bacterium LLY-WYZ-15_(1-7)]HJL30423.1 DUF4388 domain-containing protein [Polyangiaceae bacterium LLY-WYZ-15_(1-7)]